MGNEGKVLGEREDVRAALREARLVLDHLGGDAVDVDVHRLEVVVVFRWPHQPAGLLLDLAVPNPHKSDSARAATEVVGGFEVDGNE